MYISLLRMDKDKDKDKDTDTDTDTAARGPSLCCLSEAFAASFSSLLVPCRASNSTNECDRQVIFKKSTKIPIHHHGDELPGVDIVQISAGNVMGSRSCAEAAAAAAAALAVRATKKKRVALHYQRTEPVTTSFSFLLGVCWWGWEIGLSLCGVSLRCPQAVDASPVSNTRASLPLPFLN